MVRSLQPGDTIAGYRIETLLGRGGMAAVYLAEHDRLKRKVALKVLSPELAADETFPAAGDLRGLRVHARGNTRVSHLGRPVEPPR